MARKKPVPAARKSLDRQDEARKASAPPKRPSAVQAPQPRPLGHHRRSNDADPEVPPPTARRKRRTNQAINALRQIKKYQKSVDLLIRRAPFSRIVKQIMQELGADLRIQALAIEALQEATEAYAVNFLEITNLLAMHCKRVTIKPADVHLTNRLAEMFAGLVSSPS